jgi:hypothetical protein
MERVLDLVGLQEGQCEQRLDRRRGKSFVLLYGEQKWSGLKLACVPWLILVRLAKQVRVQVAVILKPSFVRFRKRLGDCLAQPDVILGRRRLDAAQASGAIGPLASADDPPGHVEHMWNRRFGVDH